MDMKILDIIKEDPNLTKKLIENEEEINEPVDSERDMKAIATVDAMVDATNANQDDDNIDLPSQQQVPREYKFNVGNEFALKKAIETIKKMSRKFRIPEPDIIVSDKVRTGIEYDEIWGEYKYYVDLIPVTVIVDQIFQLPDYEVLGVVDNATGGSVRIGETPPPSEYMTPSQECDHCHIERYRGKSWIVKQLSTGEYKRFGGDCVKKVFGINPAKFINAIDFFNLLNKSFSVSDEEDSYGGGQKKRISPFMIAIPLPVAVAVVKHALDDRGYVKKLGYKQETQISAWRTDYEYIRTNQGKATADLCEEIMFNDEKVHSFQPDNDLTDKLKTYWASVEVKDPQSGFGEFQTGIKGMFETGEFRVLECSKLIYAVHKYMEIQAMGEKKPSEYIGIVGEKILFTDLTLKSHRSFYSQFGEGNIWSFEDPNGNSIKKFGELSIAFRTSEGTEQLYGEYNKGDVFTFISDVKKHEEYNGFKSTVIGRLSTPKAPKKSKDKITEEFNRFAKY